MIPRILTMISRVRENSELVIKFTQNYGNYGLGMEKFLGNQWNHRMILGKSEGTHLEFFAEAVFVWDDCCLVEKSGRSPGEIRFQMTIRIMVKQQILKLELEKTSSFHQQNNR